MCSLEDRVWTLSSGNEALGAVSLRSPDNLKYRMDIRETLDELELVLDLAALVGDLLLSAVACQSRYIV